jgi:hypothetical protein
MGDVIKLSQFRKSKAKDARDAEAEGNRRKFGRSKATRTLEELSRKKAEKELDQHRLPPDPGEAPEVKP